MELSEEDVDRWFASLNNLNSGLAAAIRTGIEASGENVGEVCYMWKRRFGDVLVYSSDRWDNIMNPGPGFAVGFFRAYKYMLTPAQRDDFMRDREILKRFRGRYDRFRIELDASFDRKRRLDEIRAACEMIIGEWDALVAGARRPPVVNPYVAVRDRALEAIAIETGLWTEAFNIDVATNAERIQRVRDTNAACARSLAAIERDYRAAIDADDLRPAPTRAPAAPAPPPAPRAPVPFAGPAWPVAGLGACSYDYYKRINDRDQRFRMYHFNRFDQRVELGCLALGRNGINSCGEGYGACSGLVSMNGFLFCNQHAAEYGFLKIMLDLAKRYKFTALNCVARLNQIRIAGSDDGHTDQLWRMLAALYHQCVVFDMSAQPGAPSMVEYERMVADIKAAHQAARGANPDATVALSSTKNRAFDFSFNIGPPSANNTSAWESLTKNATPLYGPVLTYYRRAFAMPAGFGTSMNSVAYQTYSQHLSRMRSALGDPALYRAAATYARLVHAAKREYVMAFGEAAINLAAMPAQRQAQLQVAANPFVNQRFLNVPLQNRNDVGFDTAHTRRVRPHIAIPSLVGLDQDIQTAFDQQWNDVLPLFAESIPAFQTDGLDAECVPLDVMFPNTIMLAATGSARDKRLLRAYADARTPDRVPIPAPAPLAAPPPVAAPAPPVVRALRIAQGLSRPIAPGVDAALAERNPDVMIRDLLSLVHAAERAFRRAIAAEERAGPEEGEIAIAQTAAERSREQVRRVIRARVVPLDNDIRTFVVEARREYGAMYAAHRAYDPLTLDSYVYNVRGVLRATGSAASAFVLDVATGERSNIVSLLAPERLMTASISSHLHTRQPEVNDADIDAINVAILAQARPAATIRRIEAEDGPKNDDELKFLGKLLAFTNKWVAQWKKIAAEYGATRSAVLDAVRAAGAELTDAPPLDLAWLAAPGLAWLAAPGLENRYDGAFVLRVQYVWVGGGDAPGAVHIDGTTHVFRREDDAGAAKRQRRDAATYVLQFGSAEGAEGASVVESFEASGLAYVGDQGPLQLTVAALGPHVPFAHAYTYAVPGAGRKTFVFRGMDTDRRVVKYGEMAANEDLRACPAGFHPTGAWAERPAGVFHPVFANWFEN